MDEQSAKQFQLFGLLKLIRVLRLNRIIMYLNLKQDIKAVSDIRPLTDPICTVDQTGQTDLLPADVRPLHRLHLVLHQ